MSELLLCSPRMGRTWGVAVFGAIDANDFVARPASSPTRPFARPRVPDERDEPPTDRRIRGGVDQVPGGSAVACQGGDPCRLVVGEATVGEGEDRQVALGVALRVAHLDDRQRDVAPGRRDGHRVDDRQSSDGSRPPAVPALVGEPRAQGADELARPACRRELGEGRRTLEGGPDRGAADPGGRRTVVPELEPQEAVRAQADEPRLVADLREVDRAEELDGDATRVLREVQTRPLREARQVRDDEDPSRPRSWRTNASTLRLSGCRNSSVARGRRPAWRLRRAISRRIHHSSECGLRCCASTLTAS